MALSYLADTSVLTRLAVPQVRDALQQLLGSAAIARSTMTELELGFSARNAAEWDRIRAAAGAFLHVEVTEEDFRRAGQVQRLLAVAGLKGRKVPDLLIAAAAERTRLAVLHYDRDFEHIAHLTGQAHQWIVPPGTVD
ncbi:MAG: PIN domain-containing protein [Marmoricola sp.]